MYNETQPIYLVKKTEAARRLSICKRTLERLMARHEFPPPVKIGKASLVAVSDIDAYLAKLLGQREQKS